MKKNYYDLTIDILPGFNDLWSNTGLNISIGINITASFLLKTVTKITNDSYPIMHSSINKIAHLLCHIVFTFNMIENSK